MIDTIAALVAGRGKIATGMKNRGKGLDTE
jgi:hypothetical protein